jgi:hypothetical protein
MSLYEQSLADGEQAIQIFAELSGMDPEAGNTMIEGATEPIVGLYGTTRVTYTREEGGGMRKRTEVPLSISRETLTVPPQVNSRLVRIDLTPRITYNIMKVDTQDPVFWVLTLVNHAA